MLLLSSSDKVQNDRIVWVDKRFSSFALFARSFCGRLFGEPLMQGTEKHEETAILSHASSNKEHELGGPIT